MSGHSKWATIKHAKGLADAKRGKIFTKFIKEISIAARMGGGDPNSNPRLRTVIIKARAANMPKDNIERAIKKGTGEDGGAAYEELVYEGYAAGGVAVMVEVLTDNKNRAAADVRNVFTKNGGNLGTTGSVSRMFQRKGTIELDAEKVSEDDVMEVALEAGADDIVNEDGIIPVTTTPDAFSVGADALDEKGIYSIEHYLVAGFFMYWQVYYHKAAVFVLLQVSSTDTNEYRNLRQGLLISYRAPGGLN